MAEAPPSINSVTKGCYEFLNRLYPELNEEEGNFAFSPLSLHLILSLVHQGAEGDTERILRTCLGISDKSKSANEFAAVMSDLRHDSRRNLTMFSVANKVYVNENYAMKQIFGDVAIHSFMADAENINFVENKRAARIINKWVEEKTIEKIKNLIDPEILNQDTAMVLINTIYFMGKWMHQFDQIETRKEIFHVNKNQNVNCDMMHGRSHILLYKNDNDLDAQVLRMYYQNKDFFMVIALPKENYGIDGLETKLKNYDLTKLTQGMQWKDVILSLPKFKVETNIKLDKPLKKVGLQNMYSKDANFNGMLVTQRPIAVDTVVQKVFIGVNEKGTEAGVASGAVMRFFCDNCCPSVEFIANRPFRFYLYFKDYLLFTGKIMDPTKN